MAARNGRDRDRRRAVRRLRAAGKLGFAWPRSMAEIPKHAGDASYDPLFPFGFGLTYA